MKYNDIIRQLYLYTEKYRNTKNEYHKKYTSIKKKIECIEHDIKAYHQQSSENLTSCREKYNTNIKAIKELKDTYSDLVFELHVVSKSRKIVNELKSIETSKALQNIKNNLTLDNFKEEINDSLRQLSTVINTIKNEPKREILSYWQLNFSILGVLIFIAEIELIREGAPFFALIGAPFSVSLYYFILLGILSLMNNFWFGESIHMHVVGKPLFEPMLKKAVEIKNRLKNGLTYIEKLNDDTKNKDLSSFEKKNQKHETDLQEDKNLLLKESKRIISVVKTINEEFNTQFISCLNSFQQFHDKIFGINPFCIASLNDPVWNSWNADNLKKTNVLRIGEISLEYQKQSFHSPLLLPFRGGVNLMYKCDKVDMFEKKLVQAMMFRILASIPPGEVNLYLIDPLGSGSNVDIFSAFTNYNDKIINSKIWSQEKHMTEPFLECTDHITNIIQRFLVDEDKFPTIEEYNSQKKQIKIPYRVLAIFGFPKNFNNESLKLLKDIMQKGNKCGISTIILHDGSEKMPYGYSINDFAQESIVFESIQDHIELIKTSNDQYQVMNHIQLIKAIENDTYTRKNIYSVNYSYDVLDASLKPLIEKVIRELATKSLDRMKLEIPFSELLQQTNTNSFNNLSLPWKSNSTKQLSVPIGIGANDCLQYLELGTNANINGLVIGRAGSGKTNLFHVIINALTLFYTPKEVELYLLDFKKGVGFIPYARKRLPHCRVVGIESDREFGLSVLYELDKEMDRRSRIYKKFSVNIEDYEQYRDISLSQNINDYFPRILLLIDEFQELFSGTDTIAMRANDIMTRFVRQGRGFGMHVILGTQTLANNPLANSLMSQLSVRIALMCSDADSRRIFSNDNAGASYLNRIGEAIYNSSNTLSADYNNIFQVALIKPEDIDKSLEKNRNLQKSNQDIDVSKIKVFDGTKDPYIEENPDFRSFIKKHYYIQLGKPAKVYIGEPISVDTSLSPFFDRVAGNNLMIISLRDEVVLSIVANMVLSLQMQYKPKECRIEILNFFNRNKLNDLENFNATVFEDITTNLSCFSDMNIIFSQTDPQKVNDLIQDTYAELQNRIQNFNLISNDIYLFLLGIQNARDFEKSTSFQTNTTKTLNTIVNELIRSGPDVGIHTIVWSNTLSNAYRVFDRSAFRDFGKRISSTLPENDSRDYFGNMEATQLTQDRLLYRDDENPNQSFKFKHFLVPATTTLQKAKSFLLKH